MRAKRIILLLTAVVFASTTLFAPAALADEANLSIDREMLMRAAGEIVPPNQPTEADVKIKRSEALKIAETLLDNANNYEPNGVYLNSGYGSMNAYWGIGYYGKFNSGISVNINIDAMTGDISSYNRWVGNYAPQNYIAKFTRAEARVFADNFLKNKLKYGVDDYELQPEDPYMSYYRMGGVKETFIINFSYVRKINGVLLPADTLYIGVDGVTGEVTSFSHNAVSVDMNRLPSVKDIIGADKAIEKYKSITKLSLQYITQYGDNPYGVSKAEVILAYVPVHVSDFIGAKEGVPVDYNGAQIVVGNSDRPAAQAVPMDPAAVLPPAAEKTEAEAGVLAEKYKKSIEKLLGIKFDDPSPVIKDTYLFQNDAWYFNWSKTAETVNYCNASLSIDKKTGRVGSLQFNNSDPLYEKRMAMGQEPPEVKAGVTWSAGREKALEAVKQIIPDQYGFYAEQSVKEPEISAEASKTMRYYNYFFTRVVNGVLFRDDTLDVNIDRETGEVGSFYMRWVDAGFPKTDTAIAKAAAEAKYFEGVEAKLQYLQKVSYDPQAQTVKYDPVPALVYFMVRNGINAGGTVIDAQSGKLMDSIGREIKPGTSATDPIPGDSWAKRSVELLTAQGIIKNPYIGYDAELTRAEAVKMLSLAKGQYYYDYQLAGQSFTDVPKDSEYFAFVENAVKQGIIAAKGAEFKGDEKITREEFAKLLVNLTGYAELAGKPAVFKTEGIKVTDPADTGYVAICSALGFLPVKPGETFDGSGRVTLAEAAAALYKALSYVR